ncbi:lipase 1-like [Maniola hyperantus]|uniref:lipase 1-like n=1 Tax=Aphantopus hyperantus TaxID=2795564 RepID=UPI0015687462|nr:lipase 1-like [Maniola hyperantus]
MLLGFVFCCTIVLVTGRLPQADYIEDVLRSSAFSTRISDNVIEDATLDLPDLVRKYNYPFEEHSVTTEDGYILGLHRIPHGRDSHNTPGNKPVVLLMHGLLSSSADFIVMGPRSSLAYILAEEGYDVWLGNARGNYFSRRHRRLNPDAVLSNAFWEFSWDDIGNKDLPAMIDFILQHTRKSALHYVGFSQGTTVFFVMGSLRPEYNRKIISMHAMAPVAYMGHNSSPLLRALAPFARRIEEMAARLSIAEFLPKRPIYTEIGKEVCIDGAETQQLCTDVIFFIAGRSEDQHNATMLPVILGHYPAGIALRQIAHYGQSIFGRDFRRYDHGPVVNRRIYGFAIPPRIDLSRVSAPVYLHYSESDPLADVRDVERLFRELGNLAGRVRVPRKIFSHVDFVWGINAKTLVYDGIIRAMRRRDRQN